MASRNRFRSKKKDEGSELNPKRTGGLAFAWPFGGHFVVVVVVVVVVAAEEAGRSLPNANNKNRRGSDVNQTLTKLFRR